MCRLNRKKSRILYRKHVVGISRRLINNRLCLVAGNDDGNGKLCCPLKPVTQVLMLSLLNNKLDKMSNLEMWKI